MRMKLQTLAAVALGAAVLGGCATATTSYAQLTGKRWSKVDINTYDVIIISIDGRHAIERAGAPVLVEPGLRRIVVQGPSTAGFTYGEQRTLTLDVKPCNRYWLEAKKSNSLSQDFEARVNHTEPVSGCAPKQ
jgi:hypothetical protein